MENLIEKAKELMLYAQKYDVDEIAISDGKEKIQISRNLQVVAAAPAPVAVSSPTTPAAEPLAVVEEESVVEENVHQFFSPMAGTFYRAPSPGAPPFTEVGARVKTGEPVCIVEAMKNMNQIKSPCEGVVRSIMVKNEEPVTKGQILFEIKQD